MNSRRGLHFTEVGKGEVALVFLHYFGGSSRTWQKVMAKLSQQFRCIAVDLPGFGDSQEESKELSVSYCADEVVQVIRLLALTQYVLVGHSMGGKIALSLAAAQPSGLLSVVLIAPSPPTPEPMREEARKRLLKAYGDRAALETLVHSITAQPLPKQETDIIVADNLRASKASWSWWVQYGSQEDISSQMPAVQVPAFIISGGLDSNLSTGFLHKEMRRYFPSATFAEISNGGHLLPVEAPFKMATLIREFVVA